MTLVNARTENDPVSQAILNSRLMAGSRPVPLVATTYDIAIHGGLADVCAKRTFRNVEKESIEATITFPLPVHAVMYSLQARVGDRVLKAKARARSTARAEYESAIDRGKTAVLHEELIKGIHLLSVGHIAPGTDIEITARFAMALSSIDGRVMLRIPTTVGDVYGSSGLQDCDELEHYGQLQTASLAVNCTAGEASLLSGSLAGGRASIALNAPIEIEIKNWVERDLAGRAADGSEVKLRIAPTNAEAGAVNAAILVDHSGSMDGICSIEAAITKHAAAVLGLSEAALDLREADRLDLFEFDTAVRHVGGGGAATWLGLLGQLSGPRGGTEIGRAINSVMSNSRARDIILVTDGKSHALDIQRLSQSTRRFTVVLIGEDSLEANVGHLASLSGGEIFIPPGVGVTGAVKAALKSVRASGTLRHGQHRRGGMIVEASWGEQLADGACNDFQRAVAAYATSLRLSGLDEPMAAQLAEAEGLVTHLTSLILVDEEGATQAGLPASRKIALPTPAACDAPEVRMCFGGYSSSASVGQSDDNDPIRCAPRAMSLVRRNGQVRANYSYSYSKMVDVSKTRSANRSASPQPSIPAEPPTAALDQATNSSMTAIDLAAVVPQIDWAAWGSELAAGDVSSLDSRIGALILKASECSAVRKAARRAKISQLLMVIGLLARAAAAGDRHAARVERTILGSVSKRMTEHVALKLGLRQTAQNSAA